VLPAGAEVRIALAHAREGALDAWPVGDDSGFRGMVSRAELEQAAADGRADRPVAALLRHDLAAPSLGAPEHEHLHPDHTLGIALQRMGASHSTVLPVVSRADVRQLIGIVTLDDILATYGVGEPRDGEQGA
jgi:CBS domain-containing protein